MKKKARASGKTEFCFNTSARSISTAFNSFCNEIGRKLAKKILYGLQVKRFCPSNARATFSFKNKHEKQDSKNKSDFV